MVAFNAQSDTTTLPTTANSGQVGSVGMATTILTLVTRVTKLFDGTSGKLKPAAVPSLDNSHIASGAAISLDKTADGSSRVAVTSAQRTKIDQAARYVGGELLAPDDSPITVPATVDSTDITDVTDDLYVPLTDAVAVTMDGGAMTVTFTAQDGSVGVAALTSFTAGGGSGPSGATTILDPDELTDANGASVAAIPNTGSDGTDAVASPGNSGGSFLSIVNTGVLSGHKAIDSFNNQYRVTPSGGINTLTGCGMVAILDRIVVTGADWPLFLISVPDGSDATVALPAATVIAHYTAGGMQLQLSSGTSDWTTTFVPAGSTGITWDQASGDHGAVTDIANDTYTISVLFGPTGVVRVNGVEVGTHDFSTAGTGPTVAAIGGRYADGDFRGGFALLGAQAKFHDCTEADLIAMENSLKASKGIS